MESRQRLADTFEEMLRERLPNLFRLYLNPYLAQTCFCLERYVHDTWPTAATAKPEPFQCFLANSFDEALSGAIKLARYSASVAGRSTAGLVIDPTDRLGPFVAAGNVVFLPGLTVVKTEPPPEQPFGFVVLVGDGVTESLGDRVRQPVRDGAQVITCIDRASLVSFRERRSQSANCNLQFAIPPDIVVFDESFVHHDVPFGAFAARKTLYDHWNRPARSTFHSTTFQPNTISTLHFMRCLARDDPDFHAQIAAELRRIDADPELRWTLIRRLYSPSLARAIRATGCDTPNIQAEGAYVCINGRKVFDGVAGVACSVRGHNPPGYCEEMAALADVDCEAELTGRLRELTGLENVLPAVSGAGAVENALRLALVAQFPRRHVLALKSGFGGKTLFALTGTWNATYKEHVDPLYADVLYIDPFAADVLAQIDAAVRAQPIAVVQMELIQGVGGVRCVPEHVVRRLDAGRAEHGYLLLIDEVQTGMYRTGPFARSQSMGVTPDLLVVGKAICDMMFPFALTLYSAHVRRLLEETGAGLPDALRRRYHYPHGFKTALNVLRFVARNQIAEKVTAAAALFAKLLHEELATCPAVREVRVFGLLIGIELDAARLPQRWFRKRLFWFYLSALLRHPRFPVLVGFCQYEPNVLKITPPLTIDPDEIRPMCAAIGDVVRRPFHRLLTSAVGGMLQSLGLWRKPYDNADKPAHALAGR